MMWVIFFRPMFRVILRNFGAFCLEVTLTIVRDVAGCLSSQRQSSLWNSVFHG